VVGVRLDQDVVDEQAVPDESQAQARLGDDFAGVLLGTKGARAALQDAHDAAATFSSPVSNRP
jgi:hypothetical protein